jgi:hypothetical protein
VLPGEYAEFRTHRSEQLLDIVYQNEVAALKARTPKEQWPNFDAEHREQWMARHPPGWVEHRLSWQEGDMHAWLESRLSVLRIGRTLFLHAGLGPAYAQWSIAQINQAVHAALADPAQVEQSILRDPEGPLWYRGLAQHDEATEEMHFEALLAHFDVDRMVVGHTVTSGIILPRFGGRLILADVGISQAYGESLACLIITGDELTAVYENGELPLPVDYDEAGLIDYVEQVARLQPDNRRLARRLDELRNPSPPPEAVPEPASP